MRAALLFSVAAGGAIACGHGREAGVTTITAAPIVTTGPAVGERELSRTLGSTSRRLATEVCGHEQRCGRGDAASCVDATIGRAREELTRWSCEPAAIRARLEECLAGIDEVSCDVDVRKDRLSFCPENVACENVQAKLIAPGPELAKVWR